MGNVVIGLTFKITLIIISIFDIQAIRWFFMEQRSEGYLVLSILNRHTISSTTVKNATQACQKVLDFGVNPWTTQNYGNGYQLCSTAECLTTECDDVCAEYNCPMNIRQILNYISTNALNYMIVSENFSWCSAFAIERSTNKTFLIHHDCGLGLPESMNPFYNFISCHSFLQFLYLSSKEAPRVYLAPPGFSKEFEYVGTGIVGMRVMDITYSNEMSRSLENSTCLPSGSFLGKSASYYLAIWTTITSLLVKDW